MRRRAPAPMLPSQKMDRENALFVLYCCAQFFICEGQDVVFKKDKCVMCISARSNNLNMQGKTWEICDFLELEVTNKFKRAQTKFKSRKIHFKTKLQHVSINVWVCVLLCVCVCVCNFAQK